MYFPKRRILLILVGFWAAAAIGASGVQDGSATTESSVDPGYPMTVLDDTGAELIIDAKPQRIVFSRLSPWNSIRTPGHGP